MILSDTPYALRDRLVERVLPSLPSLKKPRVDDDEPLRLPSYSVEEWSPTVTASARAIIQLPRLDDLVAEYAPRMVRMGARHGEQAGWIRRWDLSHDSYEVRNTFWRRRSISSAVAGLVRDLNRSQPGLQSKLPEHDMKTAREIYLQARNHLAVMKRAVELVPPGDDRLPALYDIAGQLEEAGVDIRQAVVNLVRLWGHHFGYYTLKHYEVSKHIGPIGSTDYDTIMEAVGELVDACLAVVRIAELPEAVQLEDEYRHYREEKTRSAIPWVVGGAAAVAGIILFS